MTSHSLYSGIVITFDDCKQRCSGCMLSITNGIKKHFISRKYISNVTFGNKISNIFTLTADIGPSTAFHGYTINMDYFGVIYFLSGFVETIYSYLGAYLEEVSTKVYPGENE